MAGLVPAIIVGAIFVVYRRARNPTITVTAGAHYPSSSGLTLCNRARWYYWVWLLMGGAQRLSAGLSLWLARETSGRNLVAAAATA